MGRAARRCRFCPRPVVVVQHCDCCQAGCCASHIEWNSDDEEWQCPRCMRKRRQAGNVA